MLASAFPMSWIFSLRNRVVLQPWHSRSKRFTAERQEPFAGVVPNKEEDFIRDCSYCHRYTRPIICSCFVATADQTASESCKSGGDIRGFQINQIKIGHIDDTHSHISSSRSVESRPDGTECQTGDSTPTRTSGGIADSGAQDADGFKRHLGFET